MLLTSFTDNLQRATVRGAGYSNRPCASEGWLTLERLPFCCMPKYACCHDGGWVVSWLQCATEASSHHSSTTHPPSMNTRRHEGPHRGFVRPDGAGPESEMGVAKKGKREAPR